MAKAEGIPPTASVASVGPGINYAADWVYAYSGTVAVSGSIGSLLDFTTGAGVILGSIELHGSFAQIGQNQFRFRVQLNGATVIDTYWDATIDSSFIDYPTSLIIPPFTRCQMDLAQASGADKDMQMTFTGRVYDV